MPKIPITITQFKGISQYKSALIVSPDHALDCRNVMVSSAGPLQKFRKPTAITSAIGGIVSGPQAILWFTQAKGPVLEVLAAFGTKLYRFDGDPFAATSIADIVGTSANITNVQVWHEYTHDPGIVIITLDVPVPFAIGQVVTFKTVATFTELNGKSVTVAVIDPWGTGNYNQFSAVYAHTGSYGPTADTGVAYIAGVDNCAWDMVESNNVAYCANGTRASKWLGPNYTGPGGAFQPWGMPAPVSPPKFGAKFKPVTLSRTTNVGTFTIAYGLNSCIEDSITIAGVTTDTVFNGTFAPTGPNQFPNTAADRGAFTDADSSIILHMFDPSDLVLADYKRISNISSIHIHTNSAFMLAAKYFGVSSLKGLIIRVTGAAVDPSFNGDFVVDSVDYVNKYISYRQIGPDVIVYGDTMSVSCGNPDASLGVLSWKYSWKNSITNHEGPMSEALDPMTVPPIVANVPKGWYLTVLPDNPSWADMIVWYRTQMNGGIYYKHSEILIADAAYDTFGNILLMDIKSDIELDTQTIGSIINYPPPDKAQYLCKFQSRIFGNDADNPTDIWYTAFDKVGVGKPEEIVPLSNRLRLQIGAEDLRGLGAFPWGIIAFSRSNQMFQFRGAVEDVDDITPLLYTAVLDELPWQEGTCSHRSLQSTPLGLAFMGSDLMPKLYIGFGRPWHLGSNITPILNSITRAYAHTITSEFFNYLDRDWYALCVPVNGATSPNLGLIFDMDPNKETNAGIFVIDVGPIDSIQTIEDSTGRRKLVIGQGGLIKEIHAVSDAISGLSQGLIANDPNSQLSAYWRSGYFGGATPNIQNIFRYGRITTDSSEGNEFGVTAYIVDGIDYTLRNPLIVGPQVADKFTLNRKGAMCSLAITFPAADGEYNVLGLGLVYQALGVRH